MTTTTSRKQSIPESEQRLTKLVRDGEERVARGKSRIASLHTEIAELEAEIKAAAEEMSAAMAAAVMDGTQPPDTIAVRAEIDTRRRAIIDLKLEQQALQDSVAELLKVVTPKRQELETVWRRRGAEAGSDYFDSIIADLIALMPRAIGAYAMKHGERVTFLSNPDAAARVLARAITDKTEFAERCHAEYESLRVALKLR